MTRIKSINKSACLSLSAFIRENPRLISLSNLPSFPPRLLSPIFLRRFHFCNFLASQIKSIISLPKLSPVKFFCKIFAPRAFKDNASAFCADGRPAAVGKGIIIAAFPAAGNFRGKSALPRPRKLSNPFRREFRNQSGI